MNTVTGNSEKTFAESVWITDNKDVNKKLIHEGDIQR